jgi:hypothetical protein
MQYTAALNNHNNHQYNYMYSDGSEEEPGSEE